MNLWNNQTSSAPSQPITGPPCTPGTAPGEGSRRLLASASAEIAELAACAARVEAAMRGDLVAAAAPDDRTAGLVSAVQTRTEAFHQDARELAAILQRAMAALPSPVAPPHEDLPDVQDMPTSIPVQSAPVAETHAEPTASPLRRSGFIPRPDPTRCTAEGIRLLATQMAVAGSTRDAIGFRLSREFGVGDPERVLDELFAQAS